MRHEGITPSKTVHLQALKVLGLANALQLVLTYSTSPIYVGTHFFRSEVQELFSGDDGFGGYRNFSPYLL